MYSPFPVHALSVSTCLRCIFLINDQIQRVFYTNLLCLYFLTTITVDLNNITLENGPLEPLDGYRVEQKSHNNFPNAMLKELLGLPIWVFTIMATYIL